ncbi:hypothetical protein JRQ81_004182 [Phrynocephalus forsythii]|uniref:Uncharacterized protein n=1 Tax=Phrynocephalus forsythii TaxID=171643 RepID=A0A9Q0XM90_9SAUR|nr:hypothetical protein JRQ81_004182 [Phrynocephalus forsythii]
MRLGKQGCSIEPKCTGCRERHQRPCGGWGGGEYKSHRNQGKISSALSRSQQKKFAAERDTQRAVTTFQWQATSEKLKEQVPEGSEMCSKKCPLPQNLKGIQRRLSRSFHWMLNVNSFVLISLALRGHNSTPSPGQHIMFGPNSFILSSSSERNAKLWTTKANLAATFGQENRWKMKKPSNLFPASAKRSPSCMAYSVFTDYAFTFVLVQFFFQRKREVGRLPVPKTKPQRKGAPQDGPVPDVKETTIRFTDSILI